MSTTGTMRSFLGLGCCLVLAVSLQAQSPYRITQNKDAVELEAVAPNILRVHYEPAGQTTARTLVMDPAFTPRAANLAFQKTGSGAELNSPEMSVRVTEGAAAALELRDSQGNLLLTLPDPLKQAKQRTFSILHDEKENLYGICGLDRTDTGASILRPGGGTVAQGIQGNGGAPFVFTNRYGILIDSDGGDFETLDQLMYFHHNSRPDAEFFLIVGKPMQTMQALALLTGRPPMPPKWTLGFLNSQWGSTESELLNVAKTYGERHIPISGFILDFDWKAWGEDNYGEWRWNSTSGEGNPFPDKFPDGASGKFATELLAQGIHLAGILKPRILVNRQDGKPTEASAYATAHGFWYPNEKRENDYFTHRLAGNIDFNNAEARKWFWEHLRPSFRAGITGWWNDEADYNSTTVFNNFQFLNMSRMLWDGQRADSEERAWSINRSYYLGTARYGGTLWSGDIPTGFQSMAQQRKRMVAALDLGAVRWSMDTGGFYGGTPIPENYARWMEFAAFVPIFRVHGTLDQKRQPWVYGPVAEAAAKHAMQLRYDLMPYIYSTERMAEETGIGLVRPLFWVFPDDPKTSDETRAWMFGDALLISPIVTRGETTHTFYLPAGTWFDYSTGERVNGGREMQIPADAKSWQDIPMYVRAGSIVATQPSESDNELSRSTPLILDVFTAEDRSALFTVYDDDGHTYAYEHGVYFRQQLMATQHGPYTEIALAPVEGSYTSTIPSYLLRVHRAATAVHDGQGNLPRFATEAEFRSSDKPGWTTGEDRFGPVTLIRLPTGKAGDHATTFTLN